MTTISATVDVDVDLSDFDPEALRKMFRALSLGDEKTALSLLRDYLCDALGRVM